MGARFPPAGEAVDRPTVTPRATEGHLRIDTARSVNHVSKTHQITAECLLFGALSDFDVGKPMW